MPLNEKDAPRKPPARPGKGGRFLRLGEVSRGGIGFVEAAVDPVIGRKVALKALRPEHLEDEYTVSKFAEEAQITGQLEHPNIAPIYDLRSEDDGQFIVMKLIKGRSLAQLLDENATERRQPDGLQRFVQILLRLCDALSYAHSRGVIHCDIKPDNIMVGAHGQVYLMDWGVALLMSKRTTEPPSQSVFESGERERPRWDGDSPDSFVRVTTAGGETHALKGTPAYMAPEQLLGRTDEIDARTDVFGLGAVLYEILTGRPPNDRSRFLGPAIHQPLPTPVESPIWMQLPPGLCQIALKALSPAREERYPSIEAMRQDLEQFLKGGGWFETHVFKTGESVVVEGEVGEAAYIIESGHCDVYKEVQGERVLLRRLGPGDVFGETAIWTEATRTASVVAVDEVRVKLITAASLNRELDRNPWLAAFVRSLANLFRETDARISQPASLKSE